MNKRLIKKKVKVMSDNQICEHVAYGSGYWRHFAELEFDRRFDQNYAVKQIKKLEEFKMTTNKQELMKVMGYSQEEVKGMTEEDCEIELSYMSEGQDI